MARIILDVANVDAQEFVKKLMDSSVITSEVATAYVIDETNNNQQHEDSTKNFFSVEQLQNFSRQLSDRKYQDDFMNFGIDEMMYEFHIIIDHILFHDYFGEDVGTMDITPKAVELLKEFRESSHYTLDMGMYMCITNFLRNKYS